MFERIELQELLGDLSTDCAAVWPDEEGARLAAHVLRKLGNEVRPYVIARGVDPDDPTELQAYADMASCVGFMHTCRCAAVAFDHWQDMEDPCGALDAVYNIGVELLADLSHAQIGGDAAKHNIAELDNMARRAKAEAAEAKMKARGQQSGIVRSNDQRKRPADIRAAKAWDALGSPDPATFSLIKIASKGTDSQVATLLDIYRIADVETFRAEALDDNSSLRAVLKGDQRLIKKGRR